MLHYFPCQMHISDRIRFILAMNVLCGSLIFWSKNQSLVWMGSKSTLDDLFWISTEKNDLNSIPLSPPPPEKMWFRSNIALHFMKWLVIEDKMYNLHRGKGRQFWMCVLLAFLVVAISVWSTTLWLYSNQNYSKPQNHTSLAHTGHFCTNPAI